MNAVYWRIVFHSDLTPTKEILGRFDGSGSRRDVVEQATKEAHQRNRRVLVERYFADDQGEETPDVAFWVDPDGTVHNR